MLDVAEGHNRDTDSVSPILEGNVVKMADGGGEKKVVIIKLVQINEKSLAISKSK